MRKTYCILTFIFLSNLIFGFSITQIEFCTRDVFLDKNDIYIIFPLLNKESITKEVKRARIISNKNILTMGIRNLKDFISKIRNIENTKNSFVIIITDDKLLSQKNTKFIIDHLMKVKIPVVSNRTEDTFLGALLTVSKINGKAEIHLNKITSNLLKIKIPAKFISKSILDIE